MAAEVRIPRLGWSMETGVFVRWLKNDGDKIKVGEPLFELEGEKATQEIESLDAGVLRIAANAPKPGTEVPVGHLLAHIAADGETTTSSAAPTGTPAKASVDVAAPSSSRPVVETRSAPPAGPAARRLARELGVPLAAVAGTGRGGRVHSGDVRQAAAPTKQRSTPRARRLAAEAGIDWRQLTGSGRAGRIRAQDVLAAAKRPIANNGASHNANRRRTIAKRMQASAQQTAAVTLTKRVDATNLVALRQQFKSARAQIVPSYNDIVAKLVAAALKNHPALAGRWEADQLLSLGSGPINIGFAVDAEQGLIVPVLQDVGQANLTQVAQQSTKLISAARNGQLTAADLQGGCFTITNLGAAGIEAFTPIINLPEVAILGLGAIRREAVVLPDDRIVPRDQMMLSLTFDHRAVDGAPAARFLQAVGLAIENPSASLLLP